MLEIVNFDIIMRPSRNAFIGYTYQEQITFLLLVMMDVERKFKALEIEADVDNNFDDVKIFNDKTIIYSQIKNFDKITLKDLKFSKGEVSIKGKKHLLADNDINVLFFNCIDIKPNCEFLGLSALKINDIYIVSLTGVQADERINSLYRINEKRKIAINRFFIDCIDNRILKIDREDLPIINVFETKLLEKTIDIGKKHLEFSNVLLIEGKPGVGKSHYVNILSKLYKNSIVYRFWVSSQDKEYNTRLDYENFLSDISKKIFNDYTSKSEVEIITKIKETKQVVIIDGLDHVENYNRKDLEKFVQFIDKLCLECKTIILSRPLKRTLSWNKQTLVNWNEKETHKVLNELYHIIDYRVCSQIYSLTDGYPILVRFVGEHYKIFKEIPSIDNLEGVEDYYNQILKDVNTKTALTLFLTSRSFFMKSELNLFLSDELLDCINEFIDAYPYLFEIRLNRISLFHDSLNKYLRELNINFTKRKEEVHNVIYKSILQEDKRFMSRFSYFDLENEMKLGIIKKFSSIKLFKKIVKDCVDFESIRAFYTQIREALIDISYLDLEIGNYYDLSLIINIVARDHISTLDEFLFTYSKCLLFNGYAIEDITSSEYLFGMFTYVLENDSTLLYNITSDSLYDTTRFVEQLEDDVYTEETFFEKYETPIKLSKPINYYLEHTHWREYLTEILTNLYLYKTSDISLLKLQDSVDTFIDKNENKGVFILEMFLQKYDTNRTYYPNWTLNDVKKELLSLGKLDKKNPYLNESLKDYIITHSSIGSFDMWVNILSYLRLSLKREKKIDISNIGLFWCMYYKRKDYTVINMDVALKVFEENGFLDEETSIKKVVFTQNMSEKGIRHLLADYISIHSPKIIEKVIEDFNLDDLNISWFDLPPKHISEFPNAVFNYAVNELLRYHRHNKEFDFKEIINVFYSSKWVDLISRLKFLKYKIRIPNGSLEIDEIEKIGITVVVSEEDKYKPDKSDYYNTGVLDSTDKEYVVEKKLTIKEISGSLNGNYAALTSLDLFKTFSKEKMYESLQEIIYNAILGNANNINSFGSLFYLVGNVPKLINEYSKKPDVDELYNSFDMFLELSLLNTGKPNRKES